MGRTLFTTQQCNFCHSDALFADHNFHNIGVRPVNEDLGRGAQTGLPQDNGKFKTPNLRNVELHAPYMHDGSLNTLETVVEHYNSGGQAHPHKSALVRPLGLTTAEKADLVAFLKALTDHNFRQNPAFAKPE